jgi:hypothetical protein
VEEIRLWVLIFQLLELENTSNILQIREISIVWIHNPLQMLELKEQLQLQILLLPVQEKEKTLKQEEFFLVF